MLPPDLRTKAEELVGRYPNQRSALLPLLHLVQSHDGYVSPDGIAECAELLDLTKAEVGAVATFYTMYKREELGEHLVSVCTNFACKVRGAGEVYQRLVERLGVGHNGTNREVGITLEHAECLGNCEGAPVLTVDYYNYECVTPDAAEVIVDGYVRGDPPPPTRGEVSPGIRPVSHRLAGLGGDERTEAAMARARGTDGGLTPARQATAGPGHSVVGFEPLFSEGQAERREAAKTAVRQAGGDPDEVEAEAGGRSREFPTRDPEQQPEHPTDRATPDDDAAGEQAISGSAEPDSAATDPRGDEQTPQTQGSDDTTTQQERTS